MSKVKEQLRSDIAKRFGQHAACVVDYLYDMGTLDDVLARKHMMSIEGFELMCSTRLSGLQIDEDLSIRYSVSRITATRARVR